MVRYYPLRTEVDVHASGLAEAMPAGGRLSDVYRIDELDGQCTAIWMEDIPETPGGEWSAGRFRDAAMLLGRLAGSSEVWDGGPGISSARDAARMRFHLATANSSP
ncbi:hypothetical protein ACVWYS_002108 [Arthrobacter sp. TE12231]